MQIKHRRKWIKAVKVLIKGYEEIIKNGTPKSDNSFATLMYWNGEEDLQTCPLCEVVDEGLCSDCLWILFDKKRCLQNMEYSIQSRIDRCKRWLKKLEE